MTEGQTVPVQTVVARLETEKGAAAAARRPRRHRLRPRRVRPPRPPRHRAAPKAAAPTAPAAPAPVRSRNACARSRRRSCAGWPPTWDVEITALQGSRASPAASRRRTSSATSRRAARQPRPRPHAPAAAPAMAPPSMHAPTGAVQHGPMPEPWPGDVRRADVEVMRQQISEHMVLSRRTSAHVTSFLEIDFTRVARIRAAQRADFEQADRPEAHVHAVHHQGGGEGAQGHSRS